MEQKTTIDSQEEYDQFVHEAAVTVLDEYVEEGTTDTDLLHDLVFDGAHDVASKYLMFDFDTSLRVRNDFGHRSPADSAYRNPPQTPEQWSKELAKNIFERDVMNLAAKKAGFDVSFDD